MQSRISPAVIVWLVLAVCLRLLPHPANMAPIAALALFAGVHVRPKWSWLVSLCALFASDLVIGFYDWTMLFVYGSFGLMSLMGWYLRRHWSWIGLFLTSAAASLQFFLVSNFGVWAVSGMYPHTLQGFVTCYLAAVPLWRNTILGDVFYVGVIFGSYALARFAAKRVLPSRVFAWAFV